jgi:hypothetical protein
MASEGELNSSQKDIFVLSGDPAARAAFEVRVVEIEKGADVAQEGRLTSLFR